MVGIFLSLLFNFYTTSLLISVLLLKNQTYYAKNYAFKIKPRTDCFIKFPDCCIRVSDCSIRVSRFFQQSVDIQPINDQFSYMFLNKKYSNNMCWQWSFNFFQPWKFLIWANFSKIVPIMLAFCLMLLVTHLLCFKLCWHNWPEPTSNYHFLHTIYPTEVHFMHITFITLFKSKLRIN